MNLKLPPLCDWLPSRGNLLFTLLVALCLIGATMSGVLAAPQRMAAQSGTSTGTIAYQGRLADASGAPLTGTYTMTFCLYNVASGGSPLWQEYWIGVNSVQVTNGLFNVLLGSLTPIPQTVLNGNTTLWLGIDVGTDAEMTPRVQLGSAPFAMQAQHAERANGLSAPDGSPADAVHVGNNGYVGIGTTNPLVQLDMSELTPTKPSEVRLTSNAGELTLLAGGSNLGGGSHAGISTASSGHLTGNGLSSMVISNNGSVPIVFGTNDMERMRIAGNGNVGIGTTNPTNPLEMGSGAYVSSGGVWTNVSDRNLKENFASIDGKSLLEKVASLPILEWNYKAENSNIKHIGPVAQDFYAAFNLGEDDKHISTVDASGVALAAIQSLTQRVKEQDSQIAALNARLDALERSGGAPAGQTGGWNLVVVLALAGGLLLVALIVYRFRSKPVRS